MNLFASIEGLRQEDMVTALLRYLLITSPEVKEAFIQFLSNHSKKGPLISESYFSCMTEFSTTDEEAGNGDGRVDMLLTFDGAVIGLENKFYASFQPGQPQKYKYSIQKVADGLKKTFEQTMDYQIFIICPRIRKEEAIDRVDDSRNYPVVCWEDLIPRLENVREEIIEPSSKVILSEFLKYLNDLLGFFPNYRQLYMHTRTDFESKGTPLQKHFMQQLWRFLPSGGKRLSQGDTFIGYNFYTENDNKDGWCGFVSTDRLKNKEGNKLVRDSEAELVVSASWTPPEYQEKPEEYGLTPIQIQSEFWFNSGKPVHAWIVNFDENWDKAEAWFRCFEPLRQLRQTNEN